VAAKKRKAKAAKKKSTARGRAATRKVAKGARKTQTKARTESRRKKTKRPKSRSSGIQSARRADYGASVDEFVAALPPEKREIIDALREIVRDAVPGVVESIRWGMPVFTRKKLICYASPKSSYVRFGFYARIELDDPDQRIAGSLAYVKLNHTSEIERSLLHSWIQQVVAHTDA
jgi:hypothetical protein